ncbi:pyrroloquinoline quinone biosynthesis protein PqqE [Acidisphaera sp. L21]|uniref:pyrroloquinoline quinone biosynthesis protein PqqE n=1 Tax=Acidisphaera sp. L21 TaxID=1641851 RepID=UPI00157567C8|nr:pyrroloquinoline quinone biosynthesis protein PqqE [Acidisphaera sp. L21]
MTPPPLGMLAELTHRCPLQCPYCANPLEMDRASAELDTASWQRVMTEAAELGVLQVHFSGGEPTIRRDLLTLLAHARDLQLYSNLITSGVTLTADSVAALRDAGLDHVQLSFQDSQSAGGDHIGGLQGGHARKLTAARLIREAGFPLTANFVVHRQNLARLPDMIALGEAMGAGRIEIAHVQYYGWGLLNRDALLPMPDQIDRADAVVAEARQRLSGHLVIDYVTPDYYAARPKSCMGGWGRQFMNITPSGRVLPGHAAETLTDLTFPSVRDASLAQIWQTDPAFERYRGTDWMAEPCRSCNRREIDWGGCRCQAFALTGDAAATDPACALSPDHAVMAAAMAAPRSDDFTYRRIGGAPAAVTPP